VSSCRAKYISRVHGARNFGIFGLIAREGGAQLMAAKHKAGAKVKTKAKARVKAENKNQNEQEEKERKSPQIVTTGRWKRNKALAGYAGVSLVTLHRWKKLPDFPPATCINGIEYFDTEKFDAWMQGRETLTRPQRPWLLEGRREKQATA
jgi:hypothetical protein